MRGFKYVKCLICQCWYQDLESKEPDALLAALWASTPGIQLDVLAALDERVFAACGPCTVDIAVKHGIKLGQCEVPPEGWWCSRPPDHPGPCAARPYTRSPAKE